MAGRQTLEDRLAALKVLGGRPLGDETVAELRRVLSTGNNILTAAAAEAAARTRADMLGPDLEAAFERFMRRPDKTDKGCRAKIALIETLHALDLRAEGIFLRGVRHVQMEPVYGGRADTADALRVACAMALAGSAYPEIHFVLVQLLADRETPARSGAVRVLKFIADEESELLLRFKALGGDPEPEITAECLDALMEFAPERSTDFVGGFLDAQEDVVSQEAALALGHSRTQRALDLLLEYRDNCVDRQRKAELLIPIALTRRDNAFDFLLGVVREEHGDYAAAALTGLKLYDGEAGRRAAVRAAVDGRDDDSLQAVFEQEFGLEQPETGIAR